MIKLRLLAPAQAELDEGFAWYEAEQKGLVHRPRLAQMHRKKVSVHGYIWS